MYIPEYEGRDLLRLSSLTVSPTIRSQPSALMRLPRLIFAFFILLAAGLPAQAASSSADADHVHVQLTTILSDLYRGYDNRAALYFKLEPGWHIYWKNPGDAGEPPHIQWTLPIGITAGTMRFPAPKRLPLGPLMDYGYEGEVLFPIDIDVADSASLGPVVLHAHVACLPRKLHPRQGRP